MPKEKPGWANVYALVDPRTEMVCYVGKTEQKVADRKYRHIAAARTGRNSQVCRWIRELLADGLKPQVVLLEQVPLAEGDQAEVDWIADFHSDGCVLLNETHGGRGSHGYRHSEEALAKVREARARQVFSEETNKKRSVAMMGNKNAEGSPGPWLGKKRDPFSFSWRQHISESMEKVRAERFWSSKSESQE